MTVNKYISGQLPKPVQDRRRSRHRTLACTLFCRRRNRNSQLRYTQLNADASGFRDLQSTEAIWGNGYTGVARASSCPQRLDVMLGIVSSLEENLFVKMCSGNECPKVCICYKRVF